MDAVAKIQIASVEELEESFGAFSPLDIGITAELIHHRVHMAIRRASYTFCGRKNA